MAVAFDAATESVRTGVEDPYTFSHTGRAEGSGGVQGVVVCAVHGVSTTDHIAGITYGGVALARAQTNTDSSTELGRADVWWVGSGLSGKGGTQTVSVDLTSATTDDFHFVVSTLTAGGNIGLIDSDGLNDNVANPSVTLQYLGRTCIAFAALYGGGADGTAFTPNANCSTIHDHDLGAFYSEVIRQTTPGTADFAIGGTAASDDVGYAAAAFTEQINNTLTADAGSYSWTGTAATLKYNREVEAGVGSFSWTGTSAGLLYKRLVSAAAGAFSWTGTDATLLHESESTYTLDAETGSFTWSGTVANVLRAYVLAAASGSHSWTGTAAGLFNGKLLSAASGSFNWTGSEAGLIWSGEAGGSEAHVVAFQLPIIQAMYFTRS